MWNGTSWNAGPQLNRRLQGHCIVALGSHSYLVIGGDDFASGVVATVEQFQWSSGLWTAKEDMTFARHQAACTKFTDDSGQDWVLVAGGSQLLSDGEFASTEIYDVQNNVWMTKSDLPKAMRLGSLVVNSWNKILFFLGIEPLDVKNGLIFTYDPQQDSWILATDRIIQGFSETIAAGVAYDVATVESSGQGTSTYARDYSLMQVPSDIFMPALPHD